MRKQIRSFLSAVRAHNWVVKVLPDWIQQQSVPSVSLSFNLAPITPSEIKRTLKLCCNSSTPGEDRITYGILKNLPTTHHFLATLFSKIFLNSCEAPPERPQPRRGFFQLLNRNSDTERLDLNNAEWQLAWKKEKLFYPLETPPPYRPLPCVRKQLHYPKFVSSSEHQAKGYADDILITTISVNALKDTLQLADNHCSSIGLELRPDKCAVYI